MKKILSVLLMCCSLWICYGGVSYALTLPTYNPGWFDKEQWQDVEIAGYTLNGVNNGAHTFVGASTGPIFLSSGGTSFLAFGGGAMTSLVSGAVLTGAIAVSPIQLLDRKVVTWIDYAPVNNGVGLGVSYSFVGMTKPTLDFLETVLELIGLKKPAGP